MAFGAIEDLVDSGGLPDRRDVQFWQRTGVVWALPETTFERFLWPEEDAAAIIERAFTVPFLAYSGLPIRRENVQALPLGSAAAAAAVQSIAGQRHRTALDRTIVLAVDSWLDWLSMQALLRANRVKSPDQPVGLCPGEASAAIMLEHGAAAKQRGAVALANASAATVVPGRWPDGDDVAGVRMAASTETGRRLAEAIRRTLQPLPTALPFRGDIYVDLNGEEWRAQIWSIARGLTFDVLDHDQSSLVVPAIELGDVGAAQSGIAACLAVRAFARGYSHGAHALICSLAEGGAASAMLISGSSANG